MPYQRTDRHSLHAHNACTSANKHCKGVLTCGLLVGVATCAGVAPGGLLSDIGSLLESCRPAASALHRRAERERESSERYFSTTQQAWHRRMQQCMALQNKHNSTTEPSMKRGSTPHHTTARHRKSIPRSTSHHTAAQQRQAGFRTDSLHTHS
jgi:hypothetical protein